MPRFLPLLLTALVGLLFPTVALASKGPIPPPTLKEGQFVYSPDNCAPEGLSKAQQEALNGRLKNLHNPFYAVVLCTLPTLNSDQKAYARSNGFRGDSETLRIEVSTAMLMEDWAAGQPDSFDPSNSGVFVIAFKPRKFAWHPALRAKNELGLDHRAQDPYTQKFVRAAKQRPADYGSGIANLAMDYDAWYFDRTDPVRIAERKEAERKRQEQLRLQAAQAALDAEILHLSDLLEETDYLPADVESYEEALSQARGVRKKNEPEEMLAEASTLKGSVEVLDHYVSEQRTKYRIEVTLLILKWLLILSLLGFIGWRLIRRRGQQQALIAEWNAVLSAWDLKVRNAHDRWAEHYLQREDIIGLDKVTGATKELWDETTSQVDAILVRIRAMQAHQVDCEKIFKRGSYFNLAPYTNAVTAFDEPFDFDTEKVNTADLFGGETQVFKVRPEDFAKDTAALFETSIEGWKKLQQAAERRLSTAADDFPHDNMDKLFELVEKHNIPERWLAQHPLFGDDKSDEAFYKTLDEVREVDPLAYIERLHEELAKEKALFEEIERLVAVNIEVKTQRVETPPDLSATRVQAKDNPEVTLAAARQAEDRLAGLLATATDVDVVEKQGEKVSELYRKVRQQTAEIQSALGRAENAIKEAKTKGETAKKARSSGADRVAQASKVHQKTRSASDSLKASDSFLSEGDRLVMDAESALRESRHLDAWRKADRARAAFVSAIGQTKAAVAHCEQLDAEKASFESKLANMESIRNEFDRKMRGYGSYARNLAPVKKPSVPDVADYAALLLLLTHQENVWRQTTRTASSNYEAEQARIRAEQAKKERERRRREEEARRRRSSYSSSYGGGGFGGGGFGGGGFGGSSGGFGGGGFGGSSGSF